MYIRKLFSDIMKNCLLDEQQRANDAKAKKERARQAGRQAGRQTERQADRDTHREREGERERERETAKKFWPFERND